jgi:hypothetical protein
MRSTPTAPAQSLSARIQDKPCTFYPADLSNGTIAATLQQFGYLTAEHLVIE